MESAVQRGRISRKLTLRGRDLVGKKGIFMRLSVICIGTG